MSEIVHVFAVEGNIGAGKSTLINALEQNLNDCTFVPEPLGEWRNVPTPNGETINLFDMYGKDKSKYTFPFQLVTLTTHLSLYKQIRQCKTKFMLVERSYLSGLNVFTKSQRNSGLLNETEWTVYNYILNNLLPRECEIDGIIYLRTSPDKCFDRLRSRNRTEESSIDLEYLNTLHEYHENWLLGLKNVLVIDNDANKLTSQDFAPLVEKIQTFFQQCTENQ